MIVHRALPRFENPERANNCFVGVVLHLFWQSPAFVQWLLDLQAAQPEVISGEPPSFSCNPAILLKNIAGRHRTWLVAPKRCKLCCRPFGSDIGFMAAQSDLSQWKQLVQRP